MNNIESIDQIRREAIVEIKEKININPKYLRPCNKERLEDMKRLKFDSGNTYIHWMQQNGILKSPTDVERGIRKKTVENAGCKTEMEYKDKCAQKAGFKDKAERYRDRTREWTHETGRNVPKELNKDCPVHFGDLTENLMIRTFEYAIRMPYGNPGFDWTCRRGDKIENKGRCLYYSKQSNWNGWIFAIEYNDIADYFILSAWDSRDSLNPLHIWVFHKNDIVRGRKFWKRDSFSITYKPKYLKEFEKYEVTNRLDKLKELCNRFKINDEIV